MKIDFCSDLHVDQWMGHTVLHDPERRMWTGEPHNSDFLHIDWRYYKNPESRVLIIAGDTANNFFTTREVVAAAASEYEFVIVVDGNHEHYNEDMTVRNGMDFFKTLLEEFPNVHYLQGQDKLILDGVAFFGATGWYDFEAFADQGISNFTAQRAWSTYSNDSRYPDFEGKGPVSMALEHSVLLAEQVLSVQNDDAIQSIVLTTHMSPRADIMEWKANNPTWNALTPSYVNTGLNRCLEADKNKKIRYWVYGHTHTRKMTEIDGVVYANNARGYPRENPPFTLTQIEVPSK